MDLSLIVGLVVGALIGAALAWAFARAGLLARVASAESEAGVLRARIADLEVAREETQDTAMLLAPLRDTITRVERHVGTLERDRVEQFSLLGERLETVTRTTDSLRSETSTLATALNASSSRGAWGEVQLKRVLEASGMLERCDFDTQVTARNAAGKTVRPDAVVNLPHDRKVVIDSKAPMNHFLQAQAESIPEEERLQLLELHAMALRRHVDDLAGKEYWSAFARTPELVLCFVPGEAVLAAALRANPGLYEHALSRKVVLASPGTLFSLLRTIGAIWQQDAVESNARELLELGQELHSRLMTLGTHLSTMGRSLTGTVDAYNRFVGTLESRVLVTTRRFTDLGVASTATEPIPPLEVAARSLSAPELVGPDPAVQLPRSMPDEASRRADVSTPDVRTA